ncbi:MAG: Uma2 family endonuclease [Planctomycetaceae bacterium]
MSVTTATDKLMTAEEFLALPDDPNVERMLISGRVYEVPMTRRSWFHSTVESNVVDILKQWCRTRKSGGFRIASGEAGSFLRRKPDTIVGTDVAVFQQNAIPKLEDKTTLFTCAPLQAVEILSPSDMLEHIQEKVSDYLTAGVPLVWIVDPHFRTVVVHRPDATPEMFSGDEDLIGDPHLPGLKVTVKDVFADL